MSLPNHGPRLIHIPKFPMDMEELIIRPVGDVHYGNPLQNDDIIRELIYELKHCPNMFWINAGDMMENNTKDQPHDGVHTDEYEPEEQMEMYIKDFSPVADKLLVAIGGNHDHRTKKKSAFDPMKQAAHRMGYIDRYVTDGAFVPIWVGNRTAKGGPRKARPGRQCRYRVFVTHGASGGTTSTSKVTTLEKMGEIVNADLYIGAHTHSQLIYVKRRYDYDENDKNQLSYYDQYFVNTGSALEYGGYALTARYSPQPPGFPYIHLDGTREIVSATIGRRHVGHISENNEYNTVPAAGDDNEGAANS